MAMAHQNMQLNALLAPTIQEFGYQSITQILNDLDNLQEVTNQLAIVGGKWFRLLSEEDLTGRECYLVVLKTGDVYFVVSGFGKAIYQTFGPLVNVTAPKK